jgi:hypothetical protein
LKNGLATASHSFGAWGKHGGNSLLALLIINNLKLVKYWLTSVKLNLRQYFVFALIALHLIQNMHFKKLQLPATKA